MNEQEFNMSKSLTDKELDSLVGGWASYIKTRHGETYSVGQRLTAFGRPWFLDFIHNAPDSWGETAHLVYKDSGRIYELWVSIPQEDIIEYGHIHRFPKAGEEIQSCHG